LPARPRSAWGRCDRGAHRFDPLVHAPSQLSINQGHVDVLHVGGDDRVDIIGRRDRRTC
jgi:hypothetical protein